VTAGQDASGDLVPLTLALSVRPLRSVVFVPEIDGVSWQRLFRLALTRLTSVWGGLGNLVLPEPVGDATGGELLWALVDAFDADTYHPLPVTVGDLEALSPERYQQIRKEHEEELSGYDPAFVSDHLADMLPQEPLTEFFLPEDLQRQLVRRLAPLSSENRLPVYAGDASDPPGWPLVAVDGLRPLPEVLEVFAGWPDDDLALIGAEMHGELSARLHEVLRDAGVEFREHSMSNAAVAWRAAIELGSASRLVTSPVWVSCTTSVLEHRCPGSCCVSAMRHGISRLPLPSTGWAEMRDGSPLGHART
jgi:hypothetical protein